MIALLLLLAVAGWTAILTRGAGPWGLLARARDAWPAGPMGCPLCCGTWVGTFAALAYLAAARWPVLSPPALVLAAAGAGAIASELYARAVEISSEIAYAARAHADRAERDDREVSVALAAAQVAAVDRDDDDAARDLADLRRRRLKKE